MTDQPLSAEEALRALLSVECACGPRPLSGGRVYHMQDCLYSRIRDYLSDDDIAALAASPPTQDNGPAPKLVADVPPLTEERFR